MRRSDYDVTDSIRTTDPGAVATEVGRIYKDMFGCGRSAELKRAFHDADLLYRGEHPDYRACDTEYHDIPHVLDVSLAGAGQMLGTADIIAQMSDRCYLEKCRDRLYPEFVLGRMAGEARGIAHSLPVYASGEELVNKTPGFYLS